MDIFKDKNVYVYTENDTVFILSKDHDKPVEICYEDPNRRIIANNDGSITIEDYITSRYIAQKDNCVICLQWVVQYSGTYSEVIYGNERDEDLEDMDKKHYIYPV